MNSKNGIINPIGVVFAIIILYGAIGLVGCLKIKKGTVREDKHNEDARIVLDSSDQGIGDVEISTLKLEDGFELQTASYSFSGRVLVIGKDGNQNVVCSLNDDGSDIVEIYRGNSNVGNRVLPFWDNTRILLGDFILECPEGYTLDNCPKHSAEIVPLILPDSFIKDPNVVEKWTEVIISPDNDHLAWTIRRSDCGAANAMGRLVRTGKGYEILDARYISNMNAFRPDPDHEGFSIYKPVVGGEVKQFVKGGKSISLVGADSNGMGASIVQDIASGEVTQITHNPGYDETTIFSPDEKLGIVMTTRFSKATDMGILGLVPRPFGEVLHNILGQVYMYSVTGVRKFRDGNIGPALINIEKSMSEENYMGLDLSDPDNVWVYNSPMSWKSDGSSAMWIERERDSNGARVRIVRLLGYIPGEKVAAVPTPAVGDYAQEPASLGNYDVKVRGQVSGFATVKKETGPGNKTTVTVVYENYSDDGKVFFNGSESSSGAIMSETFYDSDLSITDAEGKRLGGMDVYLAMTASGPTLNKEACKGSAVWKGQQRSVEDMAQ